MPDQTLFNNGEGNNSPATGTEGDNPLAELIGEGKKYANEAAALASIIPAQKHITTLEAEAADLRAKAESGATVQSVLDAIKSGQQVAPVAGNENAALTEPQDVSKLVTDILNEREQVGAAKANELKVDAEMTKRFGTKSEETMVAKAQELNMSVANMQELAQRSPDAFLAFFPTGQQENGGPTSVTSDVNTGQLEQNNNLQAGTKAFYDNLRRTNRKEFMSPAVQKQMMKDAEADPSKYFT